MAVKTVWLVLIACLIGDVARAQSPVLCASRPGQITRLVDVNGDGDYLDFGESLSHATGLPSSLGAIAFRGTDLVVVSGPTASLYLVRDLNGDGDAMDFGEVTLFAQLQPGAPSLVGLACRSDGVCFSIDASTGSLYRFEDLNHDGDALDNGEATVIGAGLTNPVAIAMRPDGSMLASMASATVPVRILQDRDGDGNFLGFAENISYAENFPQGADLAAVSNARSFLARPSDGRVLRLEDITADGDVLDFGEATEYAIGINSATRIAASGQDVFIAAGDASGSIWRLRDTNGDGDALDFAEAIVVAQGVNQAGGLVAASAVCIGGDLDGSGAVNPADMPGFVDALLGIGSSPALCRMDVNQDGLLNGLDIVSFVRTLVP